MTEGIEHNHWRVLFDRRKLTQSLENLVCQEEVKIIDGEYDLKDGSEHNHWRVFVTEGIEQYYWGVLFDERKWTQSLENLVCQEEVNKITGEFGLLEEMNTITGEFFFTEGSEINYLRVFLTEGNEQNQCRVLFDRRK